jgi:hypothetical protein
MIDAAQKRRLARSARADDRHLLAGGDVEVDPLQDLGIAEALVEILDSNEPRVRHFDSLQGGGL